MPGPFSTQRIDFLQYRTKWELFCGVQAQLPLLTVTRAPSQAPARSSRWSHLAALHWAGFSATIAHDAFNEKGTLANQDALFRQISRESTATIQAMGIEHPKPRR
jgi:hypothetical protein